MKSNYDRSKTIIRKTTRELSAAYWRSASSKNFETYPSTEALKRGWKAIDYLCIIVHWKYVLPRWLLWLKFWLFSLSLKIVKLAFHVLEMDFFLRVSSTVKPKNHPRVDLFWLLVYLSNLGNGFMITVTNIETLSDH